MSTIVTVMGKAKAWALLAVLIVALVLAIAGTVVYHLVDAYNGLVILLSSAFLCILSMQYEVAKYKEYINKTRDKA